MFLIQKFISICLLSPVPFIIALAMIGISNMRDRKYRCGFLLFLISAAAYLFSCEFFADPVILKLEKKYPLISEENLKKGDVYILLGGGIATDTAGGNVSLPNASVRIMKTAELYRKYPKKVYISGGSPLQNRESESSVYKRELVALGIPENDVITEEESNNTKENSIFIKRIMEKEGYKSGLLITSAIHMPRSMEVFKDEKLEFYPVPCNFLAHEEKQNNFAYVPQFKVLKDLYLAFWEYIGLVYYKIRY